MLFSDRLVVPQIFTSVIAWHQRIFLEVAEYAAIDVISDLRQAKTEALAALMRTSGLVLYAGRSGKTSKEEKRWVDGRNNAD